MNWKRTVGLILLVAGIVIACVSYVSSVYSIGTLTVWVVDENGVGIEGADVYFFEGGGSLNQPPETADVHRVTDSEGKVYFTSSGFYIINVIAEGYTSDRAIGVYSHVGAAGIRDSTYRMDLYEGEVPEAPETVPEIEEPSTFVGAFPFIGAGAVVACVGCGFIVYDKYLD